MRRERKKKKFWVCGSGKRNASFPPPQTSMCSFTFWVRDAFALSRRNSTDRQSCYSFFFFFLLEKSCAMTLSQLTTTRLNGLNRWGAGPTRRRIGSPVHPHPLPPMSTRCRRHPRLSRTRQGSTFPVGLVLHILHGCAQVEAPDLGTKPWLSFQRSRLRGTTSGSQGGHASPLGRFLVWRVSAARTKWWDSHRPNPNEYIRPEQASAHMSLLRWIR